MKNKIILFLLTINLLFVNAIHAINIGDIYRNIIIEDVTLTVPDDYATIPDALAVIDDKRILTGATVTIQVADGTYTFDKEIDLTHVDGSKIQIIGNTSNPENVELSFTTESLGIVARIGNHLGLIDGFTIDGNETAIAGLTARRGSSITTGSHMIVKNFIYAGVWATESAAIWCEGIVCEYNRFGFNSEKASNIQALYSEARNNTTGYRSEKTSCITASESTATNNTTAYLAMRNSYIEAYDAITSGNTTDFSTQDTSYIQE